MNLTPRQSSVLEFLRCYLALNDTMPSSRVVANHFGWRSQTAAMQHFRNLERLGVLERGEGGRLRFKRPNKK